MKILALIPARGGSKRLPGKNIRKLGNKPLIVWSIDIAKNIPEICDILVSTDDPEIADTAKIAGACVPWLRPANLATDTATSIDTALHALNWYENERGKVDGLLLLQPTSPFRTKASIETGIGLFKTNPGATVLGVSPAKNHPMWTFHMEEGKLKPFCSQAQLVTRSQDLPLAYTINGSFYLIAPHLLRKHQSFVEGSLLPLIMSNDDETIDIDTDVDWNEAEKILQGSEN